MVKSLSIVLAVSTGRCGTMFLANKFRQLFGDESTWITHEHLSTDVTNVGRFHRCYEDRELELMAYRGITEFLELCESRELCGRGF